MNATRSNGCLSLCSRSVWTSSAADYPQRRQLLLRTLRHLSVVTPTPLRRLHLPRAPPPARRRPSRHWATQCHQTRTFSHSSRIVLFYTCTHVERPPEQIITRIARGMSTSVCECRTVGVCSRIVLRTSVARCPPSQQQQQQQQQQRRRRRQRVARRRARRATANPDQTRYQSCDASA